MVRLTDAQEQRRLLDMAANEFDRTMSILKNFERSEDEEPEDMNWGFIRSLSFKSMFTLRRCKKAVSALDDDLLKGVINNELILILESLDKLVDYYLRILTRLEDIEKHKKAIEDSNYLLSNTYSELFDGVEACHDTLKHDTLKKLERFAVATDDCVDKVFDSVECTLVQVFC